MQTPTTYLEYTPSDYFKSLDASYAAAAGVDPVLPQNAAAQAIADVKGRIQAIMTAPEATGRHEAAKHLALNTDLTPEAAIRVLKTIPLSAVAPVASVSAIDEQRAEADRVLVFARQPSREIASITEPVDDQDAKSEAAKILAFARK